jgi:hypothetical protein
MARRPTLTEAGITRRLLRAIPLLFCTVMMVSVCAEAAPEPAPNWLISRSWEADAFIDPDIYRGVSAQGCAEINRKSIEARIPDSTQTQTITVTSHFVQGAKCEVVLSVVEIGRRLYQTSYWYGFERPPPKSGHDRGLSIELVAIADRPVLIVEEILGPEFGSCGSCRPTSRLNFLILRKAQPPIVQKMDAPGDNTLVYSLWPDGVLVRSFEQSDCHSCGDIIATPYSLNPTSLKFDKSGDITIDNPVGGSNDEKVFNLHLAKTPIWGPWTLQNSGRACLLGARDPNQLAIVFTIAPSTMLFTLHDLEGNGMLRGLQIPLQIVLRVDGSVVAVFSPVVVSADGGSLTAKLNRYPPASIYMTPIPGPGEDWIRVVGGFQTGKHVTIEIQQGLDGRDESTKRRLIGADITAGNVAATQILYCVTSLSAQ